MRPQRKRRQICWSFLSVLAMLKIIDRETYKSTKMKIWFGFGWHNAGSKR